MKDTTITCTASCGCGWKAQKGEKPFSTTGEVLNAAMTHTEKTGHATEFHGKMAVHKKPVVFVETKSGR